MSDSHMKPSKKSCLSGLPLPNNVIDNILMRLPLRDAARTSILSSEWRYVWSQLPQLMFDETYFPKLPTYYDPDPKKTLIMSIYEVLLLHRAPIRKFKLSLPLVDSCPEIDKIIQFLSRNGVEDFSLGISKRGQRKHKLLPCFFSFSHLKFLHLRNCELKPPASFGGFSKLLGLYLRAVMFVGDDTIQTFISSCPQLERLSLVECLGFTSLEINAPNLSCFHLDGGKNMESSLSLKNTPKLLYLSVRDVFNKITYSAGEFCCCMPSVVILNINVFPKNFATDNVLLKTLPVLNSLKKLYLERVGFDRPDDIWCTLWLIGSSPNLRFIRIAFQPADQDACNQSVLEVVTQQHCHNVPLDHLWEVEILEVSGQIIQLEFMTFLLGKSPNLRKITIKHDSKIRIYSKLKVATSIAECQRASPTVQIKLLD